ncbi:hypothetical protein BRC85_12045 [Halobacteriales archaeon QS_1_69_70]|nr:MAG: hypothetical protein BRC85_12045 [Halobacteriales archaeon QS_1_69_70]
MVIDSSLRRAGVEAVALQPTDRDRGGDAAVVDDEAREPLPSPALESPSTARTCHVPTPMRADGSDGSVAVDAPTVLGPDAVGGYLARTPVPRRHPDCAATDAPAAGPDRSTLLEAATDFRLVGDDPSVRDRIGTRRSVGLDRVVAYSARGREVFT